MFKVFFLFFIVWFWFIVLNQFGCTQIFLPNISLNTLNIHFSKQSDEIKNNLIHISTSTTFQRFLVLPCPADP